MPRCLLICITSICLLPGIHAALAGAEQSPAQPPQEQPPANQPPATQPAAPAPPGGSTRDKLNRIAEVTANFVHRAHGGAKWGTHSALQTQVSMTFGEQTLAGTLTFQINGKGIRLQMRDGTTLMSDGASTWVSPASSTLKPGEGTRLLHTFKVFAAAPLLVTERGNKQTDYRTLHFMGEDADTFRLALNPGVSAAAGEGGSCVAYAEQRTRRLKGLANIALPLTLPADGASSAPRAYTIAYSKTQTIEEVILPAEWSFYEWTEAAGAKGQALGAGKSEQAQFVRLNEDAFARPDDARDDKPAGAGQEDAGRAQPR